MGGQGKGDIKMTPREAGLGGGVGGRADAQQMRCEETWGSSDISGVIKVRMVVLFRLHSVACRIYSILVP